MKNFGLKPPKKDPRDLSLSKHRQIHKLGSIHPVNLVVEGLKRAKAESENQADTIQCTGYTSRGMRKRKYKIDFSNDWFCAAEARTDGKKVFTETSLRTQAKTMCGKNAFGILPASLAKFSWQVNGQTTATSPSTWDPALDKEAAKYKADAFFLCDGPNDTYDNIRLALQTHDMEGEGVTAGITWHPLEWNKLGVDSVLPMPKSENVTTGHCIHIYDWNEKGLIADAHFGPQWADGGVCYISREIANKYIYTDEGPYIFLDGVEFEQVKNEQWGFLAYLKDWLIKAGNWLSKTGPKPDPIVIPDQVIPPPVVNQPIIPMKVTIQQLGQEIMDIENVEDKTLHNPFALRESPFQAGQRIQKTTGEKLAYFNSEQDGINAGLHQLKIVCNGTSPAYNAYAKKLGIANCSLLTVQQFIDEYAPSSDKNDPEKYATFVTANLGIQRSFQMKDFIL